MTFVTIGSQDTDKTKTPTLSEYWKGTGGKVPVASHVRVIFTPSTYQQYTLISDHNFKVSISIGSELWDSMANFLHEYFQQEVTLLILPNQEVMGAFSLGQDTNSVSDWEAKPWGYKLSLREKKNTATRTANKNRDEK